MKRIEQKFNELRAQKKSALIAYICAGDPNYETSLATLKAMPAAGADLIELGVPFLDPAGDGPTIEIAAKLSIANGMTLQKTLKMVSEFRQTDKKTPLILMTYYNPVLKFGLNKIFVEAEESGVDGFLIVDLPQEEEHEIMPQISKTKLDLIKLISPTTDFKRQKKITKNAGGFLIPPSEFDIKFYYAGSQNPNIPAIADSCVLTQIDVNYTPNGFTAYEVPGENKPSLGRTGMPVAITMQLQFKETTFLTKSDFKRDAPGLPAEQTGGG